MVPLALQRAGILERVYIDWLVRRGSFEEKISGLVRRLRPALGRRMAERTCPELDPALVIRNPLLAIGSHLRMRRFARQEDLFMWSSRRTARWIIRSGFGRANVLYGFIRNAAPEVFEAARKQGLRTAGDMIIAPIEIEAAEMKRQVDRWPDWSPSECAEVHPDFLRYERRTWECVDRLTCMSDYVRDGLVSAGVSPDKITVIPYPWTEAAPEIKRQRDAGGPLVVGFVGQVGLRKGAPYFLEVARRFDPRKVRFVMVGDVILGREKLAPYSEHVELVGKVPRSQVGQWLERFDLFLFPSTCEGSAGAVMEAMASGLPVLTSPNAGSRARDGVEGFISPYDDVDAFERNVRRLAEDRALREEMGRAARQRVLAYDRRAYQKDLLDFFTRLLEGGAGPSQSKAEGPAV